MQLTGPAANNAINSYEGTELAFLAVLVPQVLAKSSLCFYVENRQKLTVGFFLSSILCQTRMAVFLSIFFAFLLYSFQVKENMANLT